MTQNLLGISSPPKSNDIWWGSFEAPVLADPRPHMSGRDPATWQTIVEREVARATAASACMHAHNTTHALLPRLTSRPSSLLFRQACYVRGVVKKTRARGMRSVPHELIAGAQVVWLAQRKGSNSWSFFSLLSQVIRKNVAPKAESCHQKRRILAPCVSCNL